MDFPGPPQRLQVWVCERCGALREHSLACVQAGFEGELPRRIPLWYRQEDPPPAAPSEQ